MTPIMHFAKGNDLILEIFYKTDHLVAIVATKGGISLGQVYPFFAVHNLFDLRKWSPRITAGI